MADNSNNANPGLEAKLEALTALMQQNLDKVAALEAENNAIRTENASVRSENQSLKEKVSQFYDLEFLPGQTPLNRFRTPIPPMQPLLTPKPRPSASGKRPRPLNLSAVNNSVLIHGDKVMPEEHQSADSSQH